MIHISEYPCWRLQWFLKLSASVFEYLCQSERNDVNKNKKQIKSKQKRRDLNDVYARAAAEAGVTLLVNSDAHWPRTLKNMRYGVATARRAWLTADQVGNTRSWAELSGLRKRGAVAG